MANKEMGERAQRVHREAIIVDMLEAVVPGVSAIDVGYFRTAIDAGVTAIHFTVPHITDDLPAAMGEFAKFYKLMEGAKKTKIVSSASDIEKAKKQGETAIIVGMQDSIPFERDLDLINVFYKLGVRVVQIAYFQQNYLGAGCGERADHGLTDRGREAIGELNRRGLLIDVSHCGDKTAMDVAQASQYPIAITHSTPATLVDMPRAKTDTTIKTVAEKGGVIGQVIQATFNERKNKMGMRPTLSDYVDIIGYLVNLVGIEHVGLGSDMSPFWTKEGWDSFFSAYRAMYLPHEVPPFEAKYVEGFNSISDTIKITEGLLRHGYSDDDAKKILGGNWLRLAKDVWK